MAKDFSEMEDSNRSSNQSIHEVIETSKRAFLKSGVVVSLASVMAPLAGCAVLSGPQKKLGFKPIPVGLGDKLVVPEGYTAMPLAPWGEPVGIAGRMPPFKMDGSNTSED
jgi:secreted PhoX family phosphatase